VTQRSSFVTGGYGLLGQWLVKALLERGDRVAVLRRGGASASRLLGLENQVTVVQGDICDPAVLDRVLEENEVESVFHLAARAVVPEANRSPVPTFEANIQGTWTVLDAVRRNRIPRTVVASSDKAYGTHRALPYREDFALQPKFPYEVSKAAVDLLARSYWHTYAVPVAVTRFANLYGGGDLNVTRLVPEVVRAALAGRRPVVRSDGTPERDFLYVEDAAAAYLALDEALDREGVAGEAFNAGGDAPIAVGEMVAMICRLAGTDVKPDIRGRGSPSGEIDRQYVDSTKIRTVCGWSPAFTLEEGLQRTIAWYRKHPEVFDV
jgi:CDP-glucose 4,6-dehydratase